MTGTQVATAARLLLNDSGSYMLTDSEALEWIRAAESEVVNLKPSANIVTSSTTLVAGVKQTVPGNSLLGVVGNSDGSPVTYMSRGNIDSLIPGWRAESPDPAVLMYSYDPMNPKVFYVYPPQPSSGFGALILECSVNPTELSTLASTLTLDNSYKQAVVDYVCYRAYMKEQENPSSLQLAQGHYAAFVQGLTGKSVSEGAVQNAPQEVDQ